VAITTSAESAAKGGDELVEAGDALLSLGQPGLGQATPFLVLDVHVVMGLGPVVPHEHRPHLNLLIVVGCRSPRRPAARSWFSARGTSSHQLSMVDLTDRQAHDLGLGIDSSRS
jgi:hypothetical protein